MRPLPLKIRVAREVDGLHCLSVLVARGTAGGHFVPSCVRPIARTLGPRQRLGEEGRGSLLVVETQHGGSGSASHGGCELQFAPLLQQSTVAGPMLAVSEARREHPSLAFDWLSRGLWLFPSQRPDRDLTRRATILANFGPSHRNLRPSAGRAAFYTRAAGRLAYWPRAAESRRCNPSKRHFRSMELGALTSCPESTI